MVATKIFFAIHQTLTPNTFMQNTTRRQKERPEQPSSAKQQHKMSRFCVGELYLFLFGIHAISTHSAENRFETK